MALLQVVVKQLHSIDGTSAGAAYIEFHDHTGKIIRDEFHGKTTGEPGYTRAYYVESDEKSLPVVRLLPKTSPHAVVTAHLIESSARWQVVVEDQRKKWVGNNTVMHYAPNARMVAYEEYIKRLGGACPLTAYACPKCEFTIHCVNMTGDSACVCPSCGELHMRFVTTKGAFGV